MILFDNLISTGYLYKKRVFIRLDLNVPQDKYGNIIEDFRIKASLPTIISAINAKASVMICSHLGRPQEGKFSQKYSLLSVAKYLSNILNRKIDLLVNWTELSINVNPGNIVLLENCRFNKGEKNNSDDLAKKMAKLCDIYVNDAFSVSHRIEASTYGIAKYAPISCAGPLLFHEISYLTKIFKEIKHPSIAIIGGSKISTKISTIKQLSTKITHLVIGGAIANTLMLSCGLKIGKSLSEPRALSEAKEIINFINKQKKFIQLPVDVVTTKKISRIEKVEIKKINNICEDDIILDIGRETINIIKNQINNSNTIIWNGPLGFFELEKFVNSNKIISKSISKSLAFSIVGGGDTLASISNNKISNKINFITTGGGAFLKFLEGKKLAVLEILEFRAKN